MKPSRVLKGNPLSFSNLPIEVTPENIEAASNFAFEKWLDRWAERKAEWESSTTTPFPEPEPDDLSGSCKFTSVFAAVVFDYGIDGNHDHQFAVRKGQVIDLNAGAADVRALSNPYHLDPLFFGSKDHLKSMVSCAPRITAWLTDFDRSLTNDPTVGNAPKRT